MPSKPKIARSPEQVAKRRQHKELHDQQRGSASSRGYDRTWQKLRAMILAESPLCVECLKEGRTTPAVEVDHKIPLAEGGERLDPENCQPLCKKHHSRKTMREMQRCPL